MTNNVYLVWLEWAEKCFRVDAGALRHLRTLVPKGAKVVRVRSEREFLRRLPTATHVITWHFNREWYALGKRLQAVATPSAGKELVSEAAPEGVKVHFGHFHGALMAESVAAFMLAWARGFFAIERLQDAKVKHWPRAWLSDKCYEVAGTRAVIVGYGNVGRAIGDKLAQLGVEVEGFGRKNQSALPKALKTADWLIMALPSTTGTDDFLDRRLLSKLPKRCVVINVGRGNAVDEKALCEALKAKRIAGAYLDVRKIELSGTVPLFRGACAELYRQPNLVAMPHSSAFSPKYIRMVFQELKDDGII